MHCVKIDLHLFYFLSYCPLEFEFQEKMIFLKKIKKRIND